MKKWTLWTLWSESLMSLKMLQNQAESVGSSEDTKEDLQECLALLVKYIGEENFEEFREGNFIIIRITENPVNKLLKYTKKLELNAKGILLRRRNLSRGNAEAVEHLFIKNAEQDLQNSQLNVVAHSGLAEILSATIFESDILLVGGGFKLKTYNEKPFLLELNNNREYTFIVRLSQYPIEGRHMIMSERITPSREENRFKFSYRVEGGPGSTGREISQHRTFIADNFCRDVNQTLAYSPSRWDFPMPIVREIDPVDIYKLLMSPRFGMPPPPPPVPEHGRSSENFQELAEHYCKDDDEEEEEEDDVDASTSTSSRANHRRTLKKVHFEDDYADKEEEESAITDSDTSSMNQQTSQSSELSSPLFMFSNARSCQNSTLFNNQPPNRPPKRRKENSHRNVRKNNSNKNQICQLFAWVIGLSLLFFFIATVGVLWVSFNSSACGRCSSEVNKEIIDAFAAVVKEVFEGQEKSVIETDAEVGFAREKFKKILTALNRGQIYYSEEMGMPENSSFIQSKWVWLKNCAYSFFYWASEKCGIRCLIRRLNAVFEENLV